MSFEINDNEDTSCQNLSDMAKAVLQRKFIVLQAYIKKEARAKTNNPHT